MDGEDKTFTQLREIMFPRILSLTMGAQAILMLTYFVNKGQYIYSAVYFSTIWDYGGNFDYYRSPLSPLFMGNTALLTNFTHIEVKST